MMKASGRGKARWLNWALPGRSMSLQVELGGSHTPWCQNNPESVDMVRVVTSWASWCLVVSSAAKLGLKSVQLWWNLISQYFVLCSGILYTHLQY